MLKRSAQKFFALYVGWRLWLFALVATVLSISPPPLANFYLAVRQFGSGLPEWITTWANFDGMVFIRIAHGGYGSAEVAFFPLLPLLIRWISHLSGLPYILSGMLVSLVAFWVAVHYAYKLWQLDQPNISFLWWSLVLISFPTAHYLTAVYQDAIFLAASTATLWYARRHQWEWAVLAAMIGMLARLNGIALLVILLAEFYIDLTGQNRETWSFKKTLMDLPKILNISVLFRKHRYLVLFTLVPAVFLGYLAYLQARFGTWQIFFTSVEVWHRDRMVLPLQTLWRYAKILVLTFGTSWVYVVAVLEAAATALYSGVLLMSWQKIRLTYWWWMLAHLLIPTLTGTLQGMPRYGLHLYPLFMVMATLLSRQRRWVQILYFLICVVLQIWYVRALALGRFVA